MAEAADATLQSWMGRVARVHLQDGRVVCGDLICVDNQKNLILSQTIELRPPIAPEQLANPPALKGLIHLLKGCVC
jgi:small nuclear ribonucleoprotein (snRNP)-like protein